MSLISDIPDNLKALILDKEKFEWLYKLDFESRSVIKENFKEAFDTLQNDKLQFLCMRCHGQGFYQIVTIDSTRKERPFHLVVVGGNNQWVRDENLKNISKPKENNFCNLEDLLVYVYGTTDAPIYVDLKDLKEKIKFQDVQNWCLKN